MHELPLLIFTLFLQGSVGVTLWLAFGGAHVLQRSALLPAAGAFVLASLGLLASAEENALLGTDVACAIRPRSTCVHCLD